MGRREGGCRSKLAFDKIEVAGKLGVGEDVVLGVADLVEPGIENYVELKLEVIHGPTKFSWTSLLKSCGPALNWPCATTASSLFRAFSISPTGQLRSRSHYLL